MDQARGTNGLRSGQYPDIPSPAEQGSLFDLMEAVDRVVSLNGPRNRDMSNCWECTDDTGCPPRPHWGRGPSILNAFRVEAKRASDWLDGAIGQRRPKTTKPGIIASRR